MPFGTYFVRARLARNGVIGAVSNEVELRVVCTPPPELTNARVEVLGNVARFTWQVPFVPTADYQLTLEAGSQPGAADLASIVVPQGANGGFSVPGPPGTYYTRLRATNSCGSTVSAELPVTLEACVPPDPIPFIDASMVNGSNAVNLFWEPASTGGLVTTYEVEVGSSPGSADLGRRTVDGRYAPGNLFFQTFSGVASPRAYATVMPVNSCGAAPRPAEAHANTGSCQNPPAPRYTWAQVSGNSVLLWWNGTSEYESITRTFVEIGTQPGAANVLTSPQIGWARVPDVHHDLAAGPGLRQGSPSALGVRRGQQSISRGDVRCPLSIATALVWDDRRACDTVSPSPGAS